MKPKMAVMYYSEDSRMIDESVTYEWLPVRCSVCKEHGHQAYACRRRVIKKLWVPKQNPQTPVPPVSNPVPEVPVLQSNPTAADAEGSEWITVRNRKRSASASKQPQNKAATTVAGPSASTIGVMGVARGVSSREMGSTAGVSQPPLPPNG